MSRTVKIVNRAENAPAITTQFVAPARCKEKRFSILKTDDYRIWLNHPNPVANSMAGECYPAQFMTSFMAQRRGTAVPAFEQLVCPDYYRTVIQDGDYIACCPDGFGLHPNPNAPADLPASGGTCYSDIDTIMITAYDEKGITATDTWIATTKPAQAYAYPIDGFIAKREQPKPPPSPTPTPRDTPRGGEGSSPTPKPSTKTTNGGSSPRPTNGNSGGVDGDDDNDDDVKSPSNGGGGGGEDDRGRDDNDQEDTGSNSGTPPSDTLGGGPATGSKSSSKPSPKPSSKPTLKPSPNPIPELTSISTRKTASDRNTTDSGNPDRTRGSDDSDSSDTTTTKRRNSGTNFQETMPTTIVVVQNGQTITTTSSIPVNTAGDPAELGAGTSKDDSPSSGNGFTTGAIVGVVIGGLALIALLALIVILLRRRKRRNAGPGVWDESTKPGGYSGAVEAGHGQLEKDSYGYPSDVKHVGSPLVTPVYGGAPTELSDERATELSNERPVELYQQNVNGRAELGDYHAVELEAIERTGTNGSAATVTHPSRSPLDEHGNEILGADSSSPKSAQAGYATFGLGNTTDMPNSADARDNTISQTSADPQPRYTYRLSNLENSR